VQIIFHQQDKLFVKSDPLYTLINSVTEMYDNKSILSTLREMNECLPPILSYIANTLPMHNFWSEKMIRNPSTSKGLFCEILAQPISK
jgi:hypothetical protein